MAIRQDRSDLPRGDEGWPPDSVALIRDALLEEWATNVRPEKGRERAVGGTLWRASFAANCRRSLAYSMYDQPKTNPPTVADRWRMNVGQMVHTELDLMAEALQRSFEVMKPGTVVEVEVPVDLRPVGLDGSATVDLLIRKADGTVTIVEVKSVVGFKFKQKATKFNGPPKGPDLSHIIQSAVAGKALDARAVTILYLSIENVGPSLAYRVEGDTAATVDLNRMSAQWTLPRDAYLPIADAEIARVNEVIAACESGVLPDRLVPNDDGVERLVVNPEKGLWNQVAADGRVEDSGKAWQCDYCDYRDRCLADGPSGPFVR